MCYEANRFIIDRFYSVPHLGLNRREIKPVLRRLPRLPKPEKLMYIDFDETRLSIVESNMVSEQRSSSICTHKSTKSSLIQKNSLQRIRLLCTYVRDDVWIKSCKNKWSVIESDRKLIKHSTSFTTLWSLFCRNVSIRRTIFILHSCQNYQDIVPFHYGLYFAAWKTLTNFCLNIIKQILYIIKL